MPHFQESSLEHKLGESDADRDKRLAHNLFVRFRKSLKSS